MYRYIHGFHSSSIFPLSSMSIFSLRKLHSVSNSSVISTEQSQLLSPQYYIDLDRRYVGHTYEPLPIVLHSGKGIHVYDVKHQCYIDFLSGYSALNFGHNHPTLINTLINQANTLSLTSRAFYNDQLPTYAEYITKYFQYDMMIPMNTGVEAGETAIKLARKWGHRKKGIPANEGIILMAHGNFWGRTITAISTSDDPLAYKDYGPFVPGFAKIPYGNTEALENYLFENSNIIAFYVEPIQGEAGIIIPPTGYLQTIAKLCQRYGVLLIFDEIQTGLGRTGKLLAGDYENIRPDILVLGKALGGGILPCSAILANRTIMDVFEPGTHGSTFGGNPLACAIATTALRVLQEEKLVENSAVRGEELRQGLTKLLMEFPHIIEVIRGKGLLNAMVIRKDAKNNLNQSITAWDICMAATRTTGSSVSKGLLAKPTHSSIIRLAPPLIITKEEIQESLQILHSAVQRVAKGESKLK